MSEKIKVGVGLSGGVDSAVTAALLCKAGYEVTAVTMVFSDGKNSLDMVLDSKQVAESLGIDHHVVDLRKIFRKYVINEFLNAYVKGKTPNPCMECNRYVKFTGLFEYCKKMGIEKIATGHYAQVLQDEISGNYFLWRGIDQKKDQSYFLYALSQDILSSVLMPLGIYIKEEVRKMAEQFHLPTAQKTESQDICFLNDNKYKDYLLTHMPKGIEPGNIVDMKGITLGCHKGLAFYTIGQRRGLGISARKPLYVISLNRQQNQVLVGEKKDLLSRGLLAHEVIWQVTTGIEKEMTVLVQIRYRKKPVKANITVLENQKVMVKFSEPQRSVTPGQFAVFYLGQRVLGGGRIQQAI